MTPDKPENGVRQPIINFKTNTGLTDYYCPFCDKKLFRGKVNEFNMVCSHCNKLVRSSNISDQSHSTKESLNPESSDPESSNPE